MKGVETEQNVGNPLPSRFHLSGAIMKKELLQMGIVDLFPFRYRGSEAAADIVQQLQKICVMHGLGRTRPINKVFQGYSRLALERAQQDFWSATERRQMEQRQIIPLSKEKLGLLSRPLQMTVVRFLAEHRRVVVTAELCRGNLYPALSIELWLKKPVQLFGGFIEVATVQHAPERKLAVEIASQIRDSLKLPRRLTTAESAH